MKMPGGLATAGQVSCGAQVPFGGSTLARAIHFVFLQAHGELGALLRSALSCANDGVALWK
jgi:hypothetical protein